MSPTGFRSATGRKIRFAINRIASRRSPALTGLRSFLSSLKRRTSSSKIVPIAWLSIAAGLRSISGSRNLLIKLLRGHPLWTASAAEFLNLKFSMMS